MGYLDLYREELDNEETQYFIFDTSGVEGIWET